MNRSAHNRAAGIGKSNTRVVNMFGRWLDMEIPDDITRDVSNIVRVMIGLDPNYTVTSSREEVLAKVNSIADRAECLHDACGQAMYLIRGDYGSGYYLLMRVRGKFYKKSVMYASRTTAMDRYHSDKITWIRFVNESVD